MEQNAPASIVAIIKQASGRRQLNSTLLDHSISKGQQSTKAQWTFDVDGYKVQISVKSDTCDFQSSAIAQVWSKSELKWNTVATIPYSLMKTPEKLSYKPDWDNAKHYLADCETLMGNVVKILF